MVCRCCNGGVGGGGGRGNSGGGRGKVNLAEHLHGVFPEEYQSEVRPVDSVVTSALASYAESTPA